MHKGWYILIGATALLIAVLAGFAAMMNHDSARRLCADGTASCSLPRG
jgi:hypothetical protein